MLAKRRKKMGKTKTILHVQRQEQVNQQRKTPGIPPGQFPENSSQFPLSRISHGCILCLLQRLAVFYKLHL